MVENAVKKYQEGSSLTQEQLANKVGVSRQTIIAIEKGNYVPSLSLALGLAKIFEVSVEKLFWLK